MSFPHNTVRDFPPPFYVAYEQACKAGHMAHISPQLHSFRFSGTYRFNFNNAFRDVMCAHGTIDELMITVHVAKLVHPAYYMDVYDSTQDMSELFPDALWGEFARHVNAPTQSFMIRVMPRWAIQTLLDFIDRTREKGPPPMGPWGPWGRPHDHCVSLTRIADMAHVEPLLHLELAHRHHNAGRTLYLQTQAATGIERVFQELRPGMNPTPLQKMIAGFLSLSFSNIAPARPPALVAASAASNAPHKRKAEEDEEKDSDRINKQKL